MSKITPFLWFDKEAHEAGEFYVSIFGKDSKILSSTKTSGTPSGTVEIVRINICGQEMTLMSAGPYFKFNEAISFVIDCEDQEEVDYFWNKLTENGGEESQCGWLKDKYGLSWQVVPKQLNLLMSDPDKKKTGKVMQAMLQMKKIEIAKLEEAYKS